MWSIHTMECHTAYSDENEAATDTHNNTDESYNVKFKKQVTKIM